MESSSTTTFSTGRKPKKSNKPELVVQLTELLTLWSLWKNLYRATME
ncbi:hypothetical protein AAFN60_18860 [Roseibacillus persicicus]